MIKALIIEDELYVRSALRKMLNIINPEIHILGETGYINEALELINVHQPSLVFMDIELEDGTGFDILNKLENINFKIIFTTAYNQHAIQAFKFSAIDYLLKPIDPEDLRSATSRAAVEIKNTKEYQELLTLLQSNLSEKEQKIVLKTTENKHILLLSDIVHLKAEGAYTQFTTVDKTIIVSKNIKHYEKMLGDGFIRCHQSHLVNEKHIVKLDKEGLIHMSNEDQIPVSTRKKSSIFKIINDL